MMIYGYQRIGLDRKAAIQMTGKRIYQNQMNEEKRKIFEQHIKGQERSREVQNERKRQQEDKKNNPQEDMLFIQKQFRTLTQEMDRLVTCFKKAEVSLADLTAHYEKIKAYYLEINYVLMSYDRQYYKETLEKINTNIFELRKKAEPKKKFKFSRRNEDFGVQEVKIVKEVVSAERKDSAIPGIENKNDQVLTVTSECPKGGSFKIISCQNMQVTILEKTEILFLKNLKNCIIKAAVTKSTVFVDSCEGCQFELNCHQLRIHNTFRSKFNIFVTSKAIIEDCDKVVFGPYRFEYPERVQHEEEEQKTQKVNLWRDIQDFNWLKENQKSPHFDLEE